MAKKKRKRGQSAKRLKALRKKHKLGEYAPKKKKRKRKPYSGDKGVDKYLRYLDSVGVPGGFQKRNIPKRRKAPRKDLYYRGI